MKQLLSLIFAMILLGATAGAQSTAPSAADVMKEAQAKAAKEKKKVFIIFHASWCGWCHRMDTIMSRPAVKKYFDDNFVIRHITVMEAKGKENLENAGGKELMEKYHGKGKGIPFWLIFNTKGDLLADCLIRPEGAGLDKDGENVGCPSEKQEVAHFIKVLQQTTSLKPAQLAVIEQHFSEKTAH